MQISILGCGWLGLPLAQFFLQQGHSVKGSTTRRDKLPVLEQHRIKPYLIRFEPEVNRDYDPHFFSSEVLIVNIPPKRDQAGAAHYPEQITSLLKLVSSSSVEKLLFVSSTSVYPNVNRAVREADTSPEVKASGRVLLEAERMIQQQPNIASTVVRFCGLFGPDRNPGRFLAGKTLSSSGQVPVNLIHQEDCIRIIAQIVEQDIWNEVFNACADEHPAKADFYGRAAQQFGFDPPRFEATEEDSYKVVDSSKLKEKLNYRFQYPDPAEGSL